MSDRSACCAEFYEQDWVDVLLEGSFHPGGPELSARSIDALALQPGDRVLDLACGVGTTALQVARRGIDVVGLDVSALNLQRAEDRARQQGLLKWMSFVQATAAALPFAPESFDAVLCECALSTFDDKSAVAAEVARVLSPGGRWGLSDMAVQAPLPPELAVAAGPWACLSDALSVEGYQRVLLDAGFRVVECVDETSALLQMVVDLKRRLALAGLGTVAGVQRSLNLDFGTTRRLLEEARHVVRAGQVQYCRLTVSRGVPRQRVPHTNASRDAMGCDPSSGCC